MIHIPRRSPLRWLAPTLGLLAIAAAGADAAPLRYTITDLGKLTGLGLDNDGQVIAQPIRNLTRSDGFKIGVGHGDYLVDGTDDGLLLLLSYGQGSQSQIPKTYVFDPELKQFLGGDGLRELAGNVGSRWIHGVDMNERGEVVGTGNWGSVDATRFFYAAPHSIHLRDLADLIPPDSGWEFLRVNSINDLGQILGQGCNPEGEVSGFLLTPENVPEPGAWAVFGLAAAAFAWRNLRRAA